MKGEGAAGAADYLARYPEGLHADAARKVLADADTAAGLARAIRFRARAQAGDLLALSRRDPIAFAGAHRAWAQALDQAGVGIMDLDLVETHDCFTIAEMIEYEAMGLAPRGQGWRVIREGTTRMDGKLPVNPSGGLKSRGHPIGATGSLLIGTLLDELERRDLSTGLATLCIASGMGAATIIERV